MGLKGLCIGLVLGIIIGIVNFLLKNYSYEKTTSVSCKNVEVVFSYVFSFYLFVCPYLQLYEVDLKLL